ncbi:MAG: substrate-binding domain-containing protein [Kiritimatiellia bacterium]
MSIVKSNEQTNRLPESTRQAEIVRRRSPHPVVVVSLEDNYKGQEAVLAAAEKKGWHLVDLAFRRGHMPDTDRIKGAIVNGSPENEIVAPLLRLGKPVVRLGRFASPYDRKMPVVIPDWDAVAALAAAHFAERGFRHVGFIGRAPWGHFEPLYEAFRGHAESLGGQCHLLRLMVLPETKYRDHYDRHKACIREWLQAVPMPLGLLGIGDHWAAELVYMCTEAGYAVPDQVAILGIGDHAEVVNCCMPHLSSIALDDERMVQHAVGMLERLMAGETLPETTIRVPPVRVVARASTDMLAVQEPLVAKALRFLWTHYDLDISVDDVAREVGLPRYKLERLFRQHLQRGVNEKLVRKRLQVFVDLLRSTDEPIGKLAARCGFRTIANLNRSFLCLYGMSPRQYRNAKHPPP